MGNILVTALSILGAIPSLILFAQLRTILKYRLKWEGAKVKERPLVGGYVHGDIHEIMMERFREKGPIFYTSVFHLPLVSVADPDLAQLVLSKENLPKGEVRVFVEDFIGESVFTMQHGEDQKWKGRRRILNPIFKISNLRGMTDTFGKHGQSFLEKILQKCSQGRSVNLEPEISRLTVDIISSSGFSYPLKATEEEGEGASFLSSVRRILANAKTPLTLLPFGGRVMKMLFKKEINNIHSTLDNIVQKRAEERRNGKVQEIPDLLDMMMEAFEKEEEEEGKEGKEGREGGGLSMEAIRDELMLLYLAGHETSANVISWAIYEIIRNPEVEEKVRREMDEVLGPWEEEREKEKEGSSPRIPTLQELEQLSYLSMVINETLRMYPPGLMVSREVNKTFEYKGLTFQKGITLRVSPFLLHQNPELWEDPEEFRPERFSKELSSHRHPFAFIPFSSGPRVCIGKNFFYLEAKMVLTMMIRNLKIELDKSKEGENGRKSSSSGLLKPAFIWVRAQKRP